MEREFVDYIIQLISDVPNWTDGIGSGRREAVRDLAARTTGGTHDSGNQCGGEEQVGGGD